MTCIVGYVENGTVFIGGDSAGVAGLDITIRQDTKVFKVGEFLIGYTSSFRMGQLLRFNLKLPEHREDKKDVYEYMCTDFIDAVRKCLKDGGYARKNNEEERGGVFLVGYKGRLFQIEGDYQVGESLVNYNAAGCGDSYAKGALYATRENSHDVDSKEKVLIALNAAAEHSAGVAAPFSVLSI